MSNEGRRDGGSDLLSTGEDDSGGRVVLRNPNRGAIRAATLENREN